MNKQFLIMAAVFAIVFYSCKNSNDNQNSVNVSTTDTVPFYAYTVEINKEADSIISRKTPLFFTETDSANKKKMNVLAVDEFKNILKKFVDKDITQMPLKQFYKENVFNDMTTVSTVMNYSTKKDSLPVKNVDVLLNAKVGGGIKRVDMKVIYNSLDSLITENYSWVFGKELYILRYAEAANGKGVATKINVSWKK